MTVVGVWARKPRSPGAAAAPQPPPPLRRRRRREYLSVFVFSEVNKPITIKVVQYIY
jgi:hypothetical protein